MMNNDMKRINEMLHLQRRALKFKYTAFGHKLKVDKTVQFIFAVINIQNQNPKLVVRTTFPFLLSELGRGDIKS